MNFDQLLMFKLEPLLKQHGLELVEHMKNSSAFQSDKVRLHISHSPYDQTNLVEISRKVGPFFGITDFVIAVAFEMCLKVDQVTEECFIDNLVIFFEGEGRALLQGDPAAFDRAEAVRKEQNDAYYARMMLGQHLNAIDKAWGDKNYAGFISAIKKVDLNMLPPSYGLKYKMAKERIQ